MNLVHSDQTSANRNGDKYLMCWDIVLWSVCTAFSGELKMVCNMLATDSGPQPG